MTKKLSELAGLDRIQFLNQTEFPLEIAVQFSASRVTLLIRRSDDLAVRPASPVTIGKLTGVQLRGVAALDQLEAMMQHELAVQIKALSVGSPEELNYYLECCFDPDPHSRNVHHDDLLKAIKAMALFCYRELIDRGMIAPHQPPTDQERNNDANSDDGN